MIRAIAISAFMAAWTWLGIDLGVMVHRTAAEVATLVGASVFTGLVVSRWTP